MRRPLLATVLAGLAVLTGLPVAVATWATADAAELRVVSVLRTDDGGGPTSVVAELRPAPAGALPPDAATVTVDGVAVPATTAPLFDPAGRTAVVVDASSDSGATLAQATTGAAGFLLRLSSQAKVTVTADGTPPRAVTPGPVAPAQALTALIGVRAGGGRSTAAALELALGDLPAAGDRRSLVLLQTNGAPPQDATEAGRLAKQLRAARAVLAVVTTPGNAPAWTSLAEPTGGLAAGAAPGAADDAFDDVAQALRARSVVTFTPPAEARTSALRLRAGGDVLSADVPLAEQAGGAATPGAPATGTAEPSAQPASGQRGARSATPFVAAAFALELAAVVALVLVRRRRRGPGPAPTPVPLDTTAANGRRVDADTAQPADGWREEHMPAGVRLFDVSDPLAPVELDAEHPEVVRVATDETAAHDQGEDEPVHNQSA